MNTNELRAKLISDFKFNSWPKTYEVDYETYANVCQEIFIHQSEHLHTGYIIDVAIGPNKGIMFKNVELILKRG